MTDTTTELNTLRLTVERLEEIAFPNGIEGVEKPWPKDEAALSLAIVVSKIADLLPILLEVDHRLFDHSGDAWGEWMDARDRVRALLAGDTSAARDGWVKP